MPRQAQQDGQRTGARPAETADPGIAALLEVLGGMFAQTFGIGHIYAGNVTAGDTKYYQLWYRNPLNSPCANDFNASNGVAVTWETGTCSRLCATSGSMTFS